VVAELVHVAVRAHVSLLDVVGLRRHIQLAAEAGATYAQIVEVLQLVGAVGSHGLLVGLPILAEELAERGVKADATALSPAQVQIRERFENRPTLRRTWRPVWEQLLRADPDYFEAFLDYIDTPWQHGPLAPLTKELVYIAIDATSTHMFAQGLRWHLKNALDLGGTPEQIVAVMRIASAAADLSCEVGIPITRQVFDS
jgi:alkylhydroperoxidase/carboxymuconolactone decarboxylase family protein YurZ